MEVCVDCVESAVNAFRGGAKRLELCSALTEGGTTPSVGLLRVVKQQVKLPVHVMVRPRAGDFHYSDQEMEVMRTDIKILKENGADGFVLGLLHRKMWLNASLNHRHHVCGLNSIGHVIFSPGIQAKDGTVDRERTQELVDLCRPLSVTFHRAIDLVVNMLQSLEIVVSVGCDRVLTSGGEATALEGTPMIRKMIEQTAGRIIVVPGGGITERNLRRILDETGASEFHASARSPRDTTMTYVNSAVTLSSSAGVAGGNDLDRVIVADRDRVRSLISIAREAI